MKYLSLFSGIEAATQAWKSLGWEAVAFSEIEPFPCAVLKHHYPFVPNLGDITKITESQIKKLGQIDLVVFGSPCQDLSIAGKREGLDGERSGLFKTAIRIIKWARKHNGCKYALWENVPGAFSSNNGADFSEVIQLFTGDKFVSEKWENSGVVISEKCKLEWRTLDAKYFGVPQRRRRIFAFADFTEERGHSVLFEQNSVPRDFEKGRKKTENITPNIIDSFKEQEVNNSCFREGGFGSFVSSKECGTLKVSGGVLGGGSETIIVHATQDPCVCNKHSFALGATSQQAVAIAGNIIGRKPENGGNQLGIDDSGEAYTLTKTDIHAAAYKNTIRRLTPIECERLQGFTDDYTNIPNAKDTHRYKALGNSMAVPVMKWIGERINTIND